MRNPEDVLSICSKEIDIVKKCALCRYYLSSQKWSILLEHYIKNIFDLNDRISNLHGDASISNKSIEIKVSLGTGDSKRYSFNYVQLRPSHNIDMYIFVAYNLYYGECGKVHFFLINKSDMENLICEFGTYAHGSKKELGKITSHSIIADKREYALRPKLNDKLWARLMLYDKSADDIKNLLSKL